MANSDMYFSNHIYFDCKKKLQLWFTFTNTANERMLRSTCVYEISNMHLCFCFVLIRCVCFTTRMVLYNLFSFDLFLLIKHVGVYSIISLIKAIFNFVHFWNGAVSWKIRFFFALISLFCIYPSCEMYVNGENIKRITGSVCGMELKLSSIYQSQAVFKENAIWMFIAR